LLKNKLLQVNNILRIYKQKKILDLLYHNVIYLVMIKLKTKSFNKWAKKNSISDRVLLKTIDSIIENLNVVDLGGGLYKVRTPRVGHGKSSGYRTLVVYKKMDKAIFVYGFSKSEKENLDRDELKYLKKLSKNLLQLDEHEYKRQEKLGHFFRLEESK
jgi:hypothetical protein